MTTTELIQALADYCSRTKRITWWGREWDRKTALCPTVLGDGQLVVTLQTLNHRPHYYVLLVDSSVWMDDEDGWSDWNDEVLQGDGPYSIDAWLSALEAHFGRAWDDWEAERCESHCGECEWCQEQVFPRVDTECGYSWGCWGTIEEVHSQLLAEVP